MQGIGEMEQYPAEDQTTDVQNASHVNIQHMQRLQSQAMAPVRRNVGLPRAAHSSVLYHNAMQDLQSSLSHPPHVSSVGAMSAQQQLTDWAGEGRYVQPTIRYPADMQTAYDFGGQFMMPGNVAYHPNNVNQLIQYTYSAPQQQRSDQSSVNQYTPWQTMYSPTQGLAWSSGAVQESTLLAQGNPFLTRNPLQDAQPGLFIQNSQPQLQLSQTDGRHIAVTKTGITETFPMILPNSVNGTVNNMRAQQTHMRTFQPPMQTQKADTKVSVRNMIGITGLDNLQKNNIGQTNMATSPTRASSLTRVTASGQTIRTAPLSNIQATKRMKQSRIPQESSVPTRTHGQLAPVLQPRLHENLGPAPLHVNHGISTALEGENLPDRAVSTSVRLPANTVTGVSTVIQNFNGTPMAQDVPTRLTALPEIVTIKENFRVEHTKDAQKVGDAATEPHSSEEDRNSSFYSNTGDKSSSESEATTALEETKDEEKENVSVDKSSEKVTLSKATVMVKPQKITNLDESFEMISIDRKPKDEIMKNEMVESTSGDDELPKAKALVDFGKESGISANEQRTKPDLSKWTVADVYDFIRTVPGCSEYADDFAAHDVDGEALMLLKADHLVTALSMTLGPAMKIMARVDAMRDNEGNFKK